MNALLIATHEQACHAILEHAAAPGVDPTLRAVIAAVAPLHYVVLPDPPMRPHPDCWTCHGLGVVEVPAEAGGGTEHCHCRCPWCAGCDEPLCWGPCPTVHAIAEALGLIPPSIETAEEEDHHA